MNYKIHRFNLNMSENQRELEQFLNSLEGEVVAIIPNVTMRFFWIHGVNFVLVVEKIQ